MKWKKPAFAGFSGTFSAQDWTPFGFAQDELLASPFQAMHEMEKARFRRLFQAPSVPRTGLEPARRLKHYPLKVACLPISPPGQFFDPALPPVRGRKYKERRSLFLFHCLLLLQQLLPLLGKVLIGRGIRFLPGRIAVVGLQHQLVHVILLHGSGRRGVFPIVDHGAKLRAPKSDPIHVLRSGLGSYDRGPASRSKFVIVDPSGVLTTKKPPLSRRLFL